MRPLRIRGFAAPPHHVLLSTLPIEAVIPDVRHALRNAGQAVLVAPPGAGKTTLVPLSLLGEPWLEDRRILLLEPRRIAARAAAARMAALLGERVGERVGYRVRLDARVSSRTRIEVVTEGILTRMLQSDPAVDGIGIVIFDEFHERSLHSDLGLAFTLQSRSLLRPDLRLLVMSATLSAEPVAALLGGAPIIRSEGRSYPVEVRYRPSRQDSRLEQTVVDVVDEAVGEGFGDILVFLPGEGEIRRVEAALGSGNLPKNLLVAPLFGALPFDMQAKAIQPDPHGRRRIVLATTIAETSLTIEGVTTVVDSGLTRVPRFSPRTGMQRLETVRVSRSSAAQRAGRAGRMAPGICYRLWSAEADRELVEHARPEILEADLAPLLLELAAWGIRDPDELAWLDAPPAGALGHARELLAELQAVDSNGYITTHGRRMAELGAHPRIAHMLIRGAEEGVGTLAADVAALLSGRDILPRHTAAGADVRARLDALRTGGGDRGAVQRTRDEAADWRRRLGIPQSAVDASETGRLLAYAYPDRLARQRAPRSHRYLLRNGRGVSLQSQDALASAEFLVVLDADDSGSDGRIYLAAELAAEAVEDAFGGLIEQKVTTEWTRDSGLRARREKSLGAITFSSTPLREVPLPDALTAIRSAVEEGALDMLVIHPGFRSFQRRALFLRSAGLDYPDISDSALTGAVDEWLPRLLPMREVVSTDLELDLHSALQGVLDWKALSAMEELAPTHFVTPAGSRIEIDYEQVEAPAVSVKLQELFGLAATPRLAGGRVPLTLKLLSPAQRPVQVTQDLDSFWESGYFEVRKDLRGRYPKHDWPEDPRSAVASRGVKRRG